MLQKVLVNFNYLMIIILFLIGFYIVLTKSNLIKKMMGLNIIETSLFLLIVSIGSVKGGLPPIINGAKGPFVDPIPQVFVVTGIVVTLGTTIFALSLATKIYKRHGTLNLEKLKRVD